MQSTTRASLVQLTVVDSDGNTPHRARVTRVMDNDEVELFIRRQKRGRLIRAASAIALLGAAALAFVTLQPSPCEQLATDLCESVGEDCAEEMGAKLSGAISQDACGETLETIRGASSVAPEQESMIRAIAFRQLMIDELGQDPLESRDVSSVAPNEAR